MSYIDRYRFIKDKKFFENRLEYFKYSLSESCIEFINLCVFTYDPRRKDSKKIPLFLYDKQKIFIEWLLKQYQVKENGVVDKCRDVGASWVACAFAVWMLIFQKDTSIAFYSYKADAVDKKGEMDALLEKCRFIIENLPENIKPQITTNYMLIKYGLSSISGLCGEQPRGGRKGMLIKDESAFYEHAEVVEGALSETSDCIIDISTHAGTDTVFFNKVSSGSIPVFTFDWWDNPSHTKEWYNKKKEIAEMQGLVHIFEREINRNPQSSIESVVINASWVQSARSHDLKIEGKKILGFDVADDGSDTKANVIINGNILEFADCWLDGDVEDATERTFNNAIKYKVDEIHYDSIGVGAGAKVKFNQLIQATGSTIKIIGWNAGGAVMRPDESDFNDQPNRVLFENAKSQAFWKVREEFIQTYRFVNNKECDKSKIIYLTSLDGIYYNKFLNELSQPQHKLSSSGKIMIDKKAGKKSPGLCDSYILARAEVQAGWIDWEVI